MANDFKPFAIAVGSRVMSQATWETQDSLVYGFPTGILTKERLNKAIRQPSVIAAAIAQYVANRVGADVLDNGDMTTLIAQMTTAFGSGGGGSGAAAQLLTISATGFAFVFQDAAATTSPSPTITFTAYLQNVTGTVTFSATAYDAAGTSLGSVTLGGTSPNATLSAAQFTARAGTRKVIVTATIPGAGAITLTDLFSVYRADGGSDALQMRLTNEAHSLGALADGTVISYTGAGGTAEAYKGLTRLTSVSVPSVSFSLVGYTGFNTTYPAAQAGITLNTSTGDYAVTAGMSAVNATVTIRATLSTGQTVDAVFSLSKSMAGAAGAIGTAPMLVLNAPQEAFTTPSNSTVVSPTSIVVTATVANIPSPTYAWQVDGVTQAGIVGPTYTFNAFAAGASHALRCTATGSDASTAFDVLTLYSLKNGDNAVTLILSNENQTIACDSAGNPKAGGGLPIASQLNVYVGTTLVSSGLTYSIAATAGFTGATITTGGAINITGISALSASLTAQVVYNGVTYQKVLTANKSLDGVAGTSGASLLRTPVVATSVSVTPPIYSTAPWNGATDDANASTIVWQLLGPTGGGGTGTPSNNSHLRVGDSVELRTAAFGAGVKKIWSGSAWLSFDTVINGNAIVGGTIASGVSINTGGYIKADGAVGGTTTLGSSYTAAMVANTLGGASVGLYSRGTIGVYADGGTSGAGVQAFGATAVYATTNSNSGTAVAAFGPPTGAGFGIQASSGIGAGSVAGQFNGQGGNLAIQAYGNINVSGQSTLQGQVICGALAINQFPSSGSATWTTPGVNSKPGNNTVGVWVPMSYGGLMGDLLWWPRV